MSVSYWIEIIMSGVVSGTSYALIGAGLSLIWGTLKMVNLAHGEYYMLGAYFLWTCLTLGHLPLGISILIAIVCVACFAVLIQMSTIRPLLRKPDWQMSPWILTLGIQILLQNLALQVWGELYQNVPYFWNTVLKPLNLFTISGQRVIILAGTGGVILALMFITKKTRLGRAIVATSQDGTYAQMMGINTKQIYLITCNQCSSGRYRRNPVVPALFRQSLDGSHRSDKGHGRLYLGRPWKCGRRYSCRYSYGHT